MSLPVSPLQAEPDQQSLDGASLAGVILVGLLALAVVAYLIIDWLRTRREVRKFELKRQRAREAWQQELEDRRSTQPPPDGST